MGRGEFVGGPALAELRNFCNGNENDETRNAQNRDRSKTGQGGCFIVAQFVSR